MLHHLVNWWISLELFSVYIIILVYDVSKDSVPCFHPIFSPFSSSGKIWNNDWFYSHSLNKLFTSLDDSTLVCDLRWLLCCYLFQMIQTHQSSTLYQLLEYQTRLTSEIVDRSWSLGRFLEQNAGMEVYESEVRYFSGNDGFLGGRRSQVCTYMAPLRPR